MNIYRFSEMWHRDGLEPSLCLFLQETQETVHLTFPGWKSKKLQAVMRYVEHANATTGFNKFTVKRILSCTEEPDPSWTAQLEGDEPRVIPIEIYKYLLAHNLAVERNPEPFHTWWIDHPRYITEEDIYNNNYNGGTHYYFDDFHSVDMVKEIQPENVQELMTGLDYCRCGCKLHIRVSEMGYTTLHCLNLFCPVKLPFVLADLARNLGIIGLGPVVFEATVWEIFCKNIKAYGTPYVRLSDVINEFYFLQFSGATGDKMLEMWERLTEFSGTLSELVTLSELPYIGDDAASKLTANVLEPYPENFREFLDRIKYKKSHRLTPAFIKWMYLPDIAHLAATTKVKLRDADTVIHIAITGGVAYNQPDGTQLKFKNKKDYIDELNRSLKEHGLDGDFRFVLKTSISKKCLCLVNDSGMTGDKQQYATENNIPIIKSNEIFKLVREVYYE